MSKLKKILLETSHRPWDLPKEKWVYYQEWNEVLFLHYEVDPELLDGLLPEGIELDLFNQKAWVSLVPFTMEQIRPSFLPAFAPISNFHEINLRTYVIKNGKSGVYFLNIESQKWLSTLLANKLSGLPYEKAALERKFEGAQQQYFSYNTTKGFRLSAKFKTLPRTTPKTNLEIWLTERYCLYINQGIQWYCYDIHHLEWKLDQVEMQQLKVDYQIGGLKLSDHPRHINYSKGVQVIAWGKESV